MNMVDMPYAENFRQVMEIMRGRGLLLGSYDSTGRGNLMTIGWGAMGSIWGLPCWIVMVRPSRYTYRCIEHSGCFSVNVPPESLALACATCGSLSGRDEDKFLACKLTQSRGRAVLAPVVDECPLVYECQVVHSNDVTPSKLSPEILGGPYRDGDFHRVYFGRILDCRCKPEAAELLKR